LNRALLRSHQQSLICQLQINPHHLWLSLELLKP
jgi:hypothetical protein